MSAPLEMLAEVPLFEAMDERERASLCEVLETRRFDKGDTIFHAGDVGDSFYIVRSGSVQIYIENFEGDKIILRENNPGDVFGDVSMFDGGPRTATAVATEDCELLSLDKEGLLEFVTKNPHAALDLLSVMGRRLRTTNELLRTQVSRNLNEVMEIETTPLQRVADWIAEFSGSMPFLILNMLWFFVWITINTLPMGIHQFDPFPFGLLTMIVSLEAIFLSCFVLISQNRQAEKDHIKADIEYEVNLKAELEVAQLHSKVDRIYEEMQAHFDKLHRAASAGK
jgi:CRP/FNR family transcriptional regulator, cyclic AMP receptor protein